MKTKKILVVDDASSIRNLFNSALTPKGYHVFLAQSAEEALDILETHSILVMFLDLNLPGMNGVELCRNVMKASPISIAFAITGYASRFQLSDCKYAGFEDYFTKPVSLEQIFAAARHAFEKLERWQNN
ncbi:MAG: response regulator [Desulfobacteraceae bacterium]|nr:MAG: response regulator [Desulfobacteraceae bacterium]